MTENEGGDRAGDAVRGDPSPIWRSGPAPLGPMNHEAEARPGIASRIGSMVLATIVGVVYGAVGTVAHPLSVTVGPVVVPWGLVLALIGVLALFVGFRLVLGERLAVVAAAVGLVGIVALFSLKSAGGSVLIPEGPGGLVWVVAPAFLAALVIFWPSIPARSGASRRAEVAAGDGRLVQPDAKEFPTP